jgi:D-xylulose reductase
VKFTTVIPDSSLPAEENAKALYATQLGSASEADVPGFDVAIEATGAEPCIQMAIHALRVGGSFVQTGLGNPNVNFPITVVSMNEITVKGCFRYGPGDYKMALDLALMGKIDLRSLITKVLPFEKVTGAWETTRRGEGIKTLIRGVGFSEDGKQES